MEQRTLVKGDVVQISPTSASNPHFAGCFMVVTNPKAFGAMGYVQALGHGGEPGGHAYYRASWAEMTYVGKAEYFVG